MIALSLSSSRRRSWERWSSSWDVTIAIVSLIHLKHYSLKKNTLGPAFHIPYSDGQPDTKSLRTPKLAWLAKSWLFCKTQPATATAHDILNCNIWALYLLRIFIWGFDKFKVCFGRREQIASKCTLDFGVRQLLSPASQTNKGPRWLSLLILSHRKLKDTNPCNYQFAT